MKTIVSDSSLKTLELGERLGKNISTGICIALEGDLGAGKTTFVQGVAKGLGVSPRYYITSPTFNIINEYPARSLTLCHLDLYRLGSVDELDDIGFDDLIDSTHIVLVEWPEILTQISFEFDVRISFAFDENYNRIISLSASRQPGTNLISNLSL